MRLRLILFVLLCCGSLPTAWAFPPAPHHIYYGTVRDQLGRPLNSGEGTIILSGAAAEIVRTPTDVSAGVGVNYTLNVPMDAGTSALLYQVTAMRPLLPFSIKVIIGGVSYVPLQIAGTLAMGLPSERTRLDLTLGVDANNDGLPDAWQQAVVDADKTGKLKSINDVKPNVDLSGNGLTNLEKFLAGISALDRLDGVKMDIILVGNGYVQLRFLAIAGRTYTIRSSQDSRTWSDQTFATDSTLANPTSTYRASSLQLVDVYVPWNSVSHGYFQLSAQ